MDVRLQGNRFWPWSLEHFVYSVPMSESLSLFCNKATSLPLPCKNTASILLPCKQPSSSPLLCNWAESPILRAWLLSLTYPYDNRPFTHRFFKKYLIYLPRVGIYVRPKRLYDRIKQIYAQLKKSLPSSRFGSDKLLSCHSINPELHLPWERKAKGVVKRVKGWLTSYIRNYIPWESVTFPLYIFLYLFLPLYLRDIFLKPCTSRIPITCIFY